MSIEAQPASELREQALASIDAGRTDDAYEAQRLAVAGVLDLEWLNDLAVIAHRRGRAEEAETLLRAALAIDPAREDAAENLAAIGRSDAAWRRSPTLGGPDPLMFERAFPGMPRPDVMSEHCSRYAFAQSVVGGRHVLDLGCGTGYGSEMLSWSAASVRGFDLWRPTEAERPRWPGVEALTYGHDLCADPLPPADAAVMFEVIEHLPDAPSALRIAWRAVDLVVGSFPNPVHHGSWMNRFHVTDWTLDELERELHAAAAPRRVTIDHYHQPLHSPLLVRGRDPHASFWVVVASAEGDR